MISVKNLVKTYPGNVKALDCVSFEIKPGDICGYIGTNGAGKSTTAKIICGMLDYDSGEVTAGNFNPRSEPIEIKKITGYVPETADLFNQLTADEYLTFISDVRNIPEEKYLRRKEYFAELFDFKNFLDESIGKLSKGNKQKILITSALLHNPDILLFDEPLNGLDANSIFIFQQMTEELARNGKTIFYCSHLLDMIEKISTKIIIIDKGVLKLDSTIEELKSTGEFSSLENLFRDMNSGKNIPKFNYSDAFGS